MCMESKSTKRTQERLLSRETEFLNFVHNVLRNKDEAGEKFLMYKSEIHEVTSPHSLNQLIQLKEKQNIDEHGKYHGHKFWSTTELARGRYIVSLSYSYQNILKENKKDTL